MKTTLFARLASLAGAALISTAVHAATPTENCFNYIKAQD